MTDFRTDDLLLHAQIQHLTGVPGKALAAFLVSRPNRDKDDYDSRLWAVRDGAPFPLKAPDFNASSPVFDEAGTRIAFTSRRGAKTPRAYVLHLDGGEATPLAQTEGELTSLLQWHGTRLLALEDVPWREDGAGESPPNQGPAPRVINYLPWKVDGQGPRTGKRTRLVAIPDNGDAPVTLLEGDFDVSAAQWSPDGTRLACLRKESGRQRHGVCLLLGDADGSSLKPVPTDLATLSGLVWSPDGAWLACSGSAREGDSISRLWLYHVGKGEWTSPLPGVQLEGSHITWHPDGDRLAVMSARRSLIEVVVTDVHGVETRHLRTEDAQAKDVCVLGDRLLVMRDSLHAGSRLYTVAWEGGHEESVDDFNAWMRERRHPTLTLRTFPVPNGDGAHEDVDAWVLRHDDAPSPAPVLVDLHGGPQSIALLEFPTHAYWLDLCARGWTIVMPNTVGSGSYGAAFARRLRGHWGELDLPQVHAILRALQDEGLADHRIACTGKSYGGYLTAWALGRSTLFRAAVVCAPVTNVLSHAGTSDSGYYVSPYAMGSELATRRETGFHLSPVTQCMDVTTPTLILQGEDDQRCPLGQSEELFAALVRCSEVTVRMVVYPGGSHSLPTNGRPSHRLDYHQRLVDWVEEWVHADAGDRPAQDGGREGAAATDMTTRSETREARAHDQNAQEAAATILGGGSPREPRH